MKKVMIMVVMMIVALGCAVNVSAGEKLEFDVNEYVENIKDATVITVIDGSFQSELIFNACGSVKVDDETINCTADKSFVVYTVPVGTSSHMHVVVLHENSYIDVDVDDEKGVVIH